MDIPEHNELGEVVDGFSNLFTDSNTTDLFTFSITSLSMACAGLTKNTNIEKHNNIKSLNFSIFYLVKNLIEANPYLLVASPLVALVSLISRNCYQMIYPLFPCHFEFHYQTTLQALYELFHLK